MLENINLMKKYSYNIITVMYLYLVWCSLVGIEQLFSKLPVQNCLSPVQSAVTAVGVR